METIGKRLAYIRREILKLNQKEFCSKIQISQGALSEVENDNRGLSMEALVNLFIYSKSDTPFSFEWFLTGNGTPIVEDKPLDNDIQELLEGYNQLDNRGKHIVHATVYQEIERMKKARDS